MCVFSAKPCRATFEWKVDTPFSFSLPRTLSPVHSYLSQMISIYLQHVFFHVPCMSLCVCVCQGPPDVEQPCEPSLQAWSPELSFYEGNVTSPCPAVKGCVLTLRFLRPVTPHSLTLWVTYISTGTTPLMASQTSPLGTRRALGMPFGIDYRRYNRLRISNFMILCVTLVDCKYYCLV